MTGVRIDKWLWAARCYKTRAKAKEAIDGGKVEVNGDRTKPSKEIKIGDTVRYRAGYDERTLIVRALSDVRRGAPEAAALFDETEASQQAREDAAARRKAEGAASGRSADPRSETGGRFTDLSPRVTRATTNPFFSQGPL